jgi:hypothetical protein
MDSWQSTRHIKRLPIAMGKNGKITAINVVDLIHYGPGAATANCGQFVIADRSMVVASNGSCVIAEGGSGVEAHRGSQVLARAGSQVLAREGAQIFARSGSVILADPGTNVIAEKGAKIYAAEGQVRVNWVQNVICGQTEFEISKRWIRVRNPGGGVMLQPAVA